MWLSRPTGTCHNQTDTTPGTGVCTSTSPAPALDTHHHPLCSTSPPPQEFSEWAQCAVLEVASHYVPGGGEAEVYDLLNVLEDRMAHTNSAVGGEGGVPSP